MNYRNRDLLNLAYEFPCLLGFIGCSGTCVPAHSNQQRHGKGVSIKAHDCYHVPACNNCHAKLDQGHGMSREERQDAWNSAFSKYVLMLWESEKIQVVGAKR